ncbi:MAG: general secretion pathway protein GspK [Desulfamplus sp.]|nr:general secretion pathway protein GspK [Desulfamplus sp.]
MSHDKLTSQKGSILVLVLWILVVISFLSSEYIAHNRQKSAIALHATGRFQREAAIFSVLELFASAQYDFLKTKAQEENSDADTNPDRADKSMTHIDGTQDSIENSTVPWIRLRPGAVDMWVKIENESSRTPLFLDQENNIRTNLQSIYGTEREQEADAFTDALLDWLDPDDLIRLNGAENAYYNDIYPPCDPGNGPFKSMSQIFLVKGFSYYLFWGNPYEYILRLPVYSELADSYAANSRSYKGSAKRSANRKDQESDFYDSRQIESILEQFTIYPKNYIRVTMLFPGDGDTWHNEIFWITKEGNSFKIVEQLSRIMVAHMDQE